jgi:hypothetical protein
MALDATISGVTSNSYVTLTEANDYFADRLNNSANGDWNTDSAGSTRSSEEKEQALITATRRIDEETFLGLKTSITQALKWPRFNVTDEDGIFFASDSIPERVKQAVYTTALELLKADFLAENYMGNFSYFSAGQVQIKQFTQQSAGRLPAEAVRLLRILITSAGGGRLIRA